MARRMTPAYRVALGGVLAALSLAVQLLGGLISVATYVTPMLSMLALQLVLRICGKRTAWAWYGAVSLLGILIAPDKEAAAVFAAVGYYPILKPGFDRFPLAWIGKICWFNGVILLLYRLMMTVLGVDAVQRDFQEISFAMVLTLLALGNFTFFALDKLLGLPVLRRRFHG